MKKILLSLCLCISQILAADLNVLALAGSTREESYNKKLVNLAVEIAKKNGDKVTYIDLKDYPMPFFDEDVEKSEGLPENAKKIRDLLKSNDAVIISTPEYNGSVSAVLKNFIDWATRNEKGEGTKDAFKGKKFLLLSASLGPSGGATSLAHLKTIIERLGGIVISANVSIGNAAQAFTSDGKLVDKQAYQKLQAEVNKLNEKGSHS